MDSDFNGGSRRKPKVIQPAEKSEGPSIHELAAREGHDLNSGDAAGPEADATEAFVRDHSKPVDTSSNDSTVEHIDLSSGDNSNGDKSSGGETRATKSRFAWLKAKLSKKQKIIALAVAILVIIAAGITAYALKSNNKDYQPIIADSAPVKPKPKPKPIYSPLSGLPVTQAEANEPVTGVMIENTLPARPQSGLSQAGVVYEAVAEAGITRFLALFQGVDPSSIGPVRSARPYFVAWDDGYDAPYAHVGGSPQGLADIKAWGVRDLDQFSAAGYYHRISSRYAPHNMYTSMSDLHALETARGWGGPSNFVGFSRKDAQPAKQPKVTTINMDPSNPTYAVSYAYNPKDNDYERSEGGQPHIDALDNQQIAPTVVVALVIPYSYGSLDSSGAYYSVYQNVGSGPAYVFQDGDMTQCTWSKASNSAPLKLVDASGANIKLDRGQTWLTAIANTGQLSYK